MLQKSSNSSAVHFGIFFGGAEFLVRKYMGNEVLWDLHGHF